MLMNFAKQDDASTSYMTHASSARVYMPKTTLKFACEYIGENEHYKKQDVKKNNVADERAKLNLVLPQLLLPSICPFRLLNFMSYYFIIGLFKSIRQRCKTTTVRVAVVN